MISEAPPLPNVYSASGQLLFTGSTITDGQGVWQSIGGQEIGTVWGHGAYVAPGWSADWLHRESLTLLDPWAQHDGAANFAALDIDRQAALKGASFAKSAPAPTTRRPTASPSLPTAPPLSSNSRPTTPASSRTAAPSTPFPGAHLPMQLSRSS
jgi:hypothetical protein